MGAPHHIPSGFSLSAEYYRKEGVGAYDEEHVGDNVVKSECHKRRRGPPDGHDFADDFATADAAEDGETDLLNPVLVAQFIEIFPERHCPRLKGGMFPGSRDRARDKERQERVTY